MHIRRRMTNDAPPEPQIGDRIGSYRVIGPAPGGGYRAIHTSSPRRVHIDIAPVSGWRDAAARMLRVAQLTDSLSHPGIVRIVDRGVLADKRPWTATEIPNGMRLTDVLARRKLGVAELTMLLRDVADVLAHAHARGVVHRALTLRSIVLATGAREAPVCVADWGVTADSFTAFAAPEGWEGDGRVDVYALGVIAYNAATGRFPSSRTVVEVPGASIGLAALITRMLAIDPAERPTSAEVGALASELLERGEGAIADAVAQAERVALETPELASFAEDLEPVVVADAGEDVVHISGPRFSKPKWTPAPPMAITSEQSNDAAGEISDKVNKPSA